MRQRFVILFVVPCLVLAWPCVRLACAQVSGVLAPADPEASGVRRDAKTAAQAKNAPPGAPGQPAAAPPANGQPAGAAAPPADAASPAPPAEKLDKYNDAHSSAMRRFKKGFI